MQVIYPRCAGLDVHKKTVVACRLETQPTGEVRQETATFSTHTRDLLRLRDWLQEWGCTHVAMESTGEYWKPVYNLLEGAVELLLVNARHVKAVPGRKTDVKDAEWLADLLRHGLLKASFVPPRPQRDLRELTRARGTLVAERAAVVNRLQKVLESANLKLASVASDVVGKSGREMLAALLAGETAPEVLADLARGRLREKREQLITALEGDLRPHHCFLVTQHLSHLDFLDEQLAEFDARITAHMEGMGENAEAPPPAAAQTSRGDRDGGAGARGRRGAPPEQPLRYAEAVRLLDGVPGIAERAAESILAETGTDMRRFPSAGHLCAWAGVAPGNRETGGKRLPARTREGNPTLRKVLIQAAHGATRTKGCYFGSLYHRLAARRGKQRALVAVGRALLVVIYHMLLYHEPYRELGSEYYDQRQKECVVNRLLRRLKDLGYEAQLQPIAA